MTSRLTTREQPHGKIHSAGEDRDLSFHIAKEDDFEVLQDIYNDVGHWLHDVKGIQDQWDREMPTGEVQSLIGQQETYLVSSGAEVIGALRITTEKEIPWEEASDDGLYVHELAVKRKFAGLGFGKKMLDWAGEMAHRAGISFLRLDCMAENPRLCRYYQEAGFEPLGQHPVHRWYALFEKNLTGKVVR